MMLSNLKGTKTLKVNIRKYKVDWDGKSASNFQFKVKQFLKQYWQYHIGVCEEFKIPGSLLRCDFINMTKKIAVEASGSQHFQYNEFFHNKNVLNFSNSIKRDDLKRQWLEKNGFEIIELIEDDIPKLSKEYVYEKFEIDIS